MDYVMVKVSFVMLMGVFMMAIGNLELWMVMVNFIIQTRSSLMKENGKIMHSLDKAQYTMKNLFHLIILLIILISISFKNTGKNMKENLEMTLKKDKVHFIL